MKSNRETSGYTMRSWAMRVVLAMAAVVILIITMFSHFGLSSFAPTESFAATTAASQKSSKNSSQQSSIAEAANVDSWAQVASNISDDLSSGVQSIHNGDTTTAASAFQRAYNVDFVASNLIVVLQQYASAQSAQNPAIAQTAQTIQSELMSLTTDVFVSSKLESIPSRVDTLKGELTSIAAQLDSDQSIKNPREFAQERAQKTAQEREKLDAAKTRKNAGRGTRTWSEVADEMTAILDKAQKAATTGNNDRQGSDLVNEAYYQYYEKLGFEKTVMSAISGARVSEVENQFKETRKSMVGGKSDAEVTKNVQTLKSMLVEDAKKLDEGAAAQMNPFVSFVTSSFGQAFVILLREGLEAILVIAAIISYLAKEGQRKSIKYIYGGSALGIVASGIMAALLILVFQAAGSHQEVFEGATALIAMVMLLYTSNWMLSKSSRESWTSFVDKKTKRSISNGSVFSLAFLAFLAVFREGAETVIFYQALAAMNSDGDYMPLVWGALAAVVALIAIFLLFRFTTVRIPYKQFFAVMSIIMSIMVVIFAGSGLHELIEADVFDGTYMASWPTNDFLGIYPYVQTVALQVIMAVVVIALYVVSSIRRRQLAQQFASEKAAEAADETASEKVSEHAESADASDVDTDSTK